MIAHIAIGKTVGFIVGLIGFIMLPYFLPDADWLLRWGILLRYTMLGAIVGIFGAVKMPVVWWFRIPLIGAWMNFVLAFFAYDDMQAMMISLFGHNGLLSSPFWFAIEGAFIGLLIGFLLNYYASSRRK